MRNQARNSSCRAAEKDPSLILWDEAPMANRKCFEALDKSLREILIFNNDKSDKKTIWWDDRCARRRLPTNPSGHSKREERTHSEHIYQAIISLEPL